MVTIYRAAQCMDLFPNVLITINIIWLISKKGLLIRVKNDSSLKLSCKSSITINLAFEWRVLLQKPSGGPSRLSQVRKGKEAVSDEFCEPTVTLMVSHPRQEATLVIRALSLTLSLSSSYLIYSVRLSTVFVHWRLFLVLFWDRPQRFSAKTT